MQSVLAFMYVLLEFNGGHVLTLLFLTGAYREFTVMRGHYGDAILMLTTAGRLAFQRSISCLQRAHLPLIMQEGSPTTTKMLKKMLRILPKRRKKKTWSCDRE